MKNYDNPSGKTMHALQPCPTCKNDDCDKLMWDDAQNIEGFVTCMMCSTRYAPNHPELGVILPS
jgi:hypothetical protein